MKVQFSEYFTAGVKIYYNGLATRFDTYRSCVADKEYNSGFCRYCFAKTLQSSSLKRLWIKYDPTILRATKIKPMQKRFERIFDEGMMNPHDFREWAILNRWVSETGCDGEPFQPADKKLGLTYEFLKLCNNYRFPVWTCTKTGVLADNAVSEKYFDLIDEINKKSMYFMDVSMITLNDDIAKRFEPGAPLPSKRVEVIKRLVDMKVPISISVRPFITDITDIDFDNYIETLCQMGIKVIHIRQFYLFGALLKSWKTWIEKNKDVLVRYGAGFKYKTEYLDSYFKKAQEIAEPYDINVTGHSSHTFDKSHKVDIEAFGKNKKYFFPYLVLPLWEMARGQPKFITYNDFYEKVIKPHEGDPLLDTKINIDAYNLVLLYIKCTQTKFRYTISLPMREIITRAIWVGTDYKPPLILQPKGMYQLMEACSQCRTI